MARRSAALALGALLVLALAAALAWLLGRGETRSDGGAVAVGVAAERAHERRPVALVPPPSERVAQSAPIPAPLDDQTAEPPDAAPAPREPTQTEIDAYRARVAPGTVEGLVLLGIEPIEGAAVELASEGRGEDVAPRLAHTSADGTFRFDAVAAGPVEVEARLEELGLARSTRVRVRDDTTTARLVLVFGLGAVEGRVHDADGVPLADRAVVASDAGGALGGFDAQVRTRTSADGRYRIGGLTAGSWWIVERPPDARPGTDERQVRLELAEGETKQVDFGSAFPPTRWTGTLRRPSGAAVGGPTPISLERAGGVRTTFSADVDGRFEVALVPGTYAASVRGGLGTLALGEIEVGALPLERDLVLAGLGLAGTIAYDGSWHRPEAVTNRVQVWLRRAGEERAGELCQRRSGERYAFYGLEPGRYELHCYPDPIVGFPQGLPVEIDGSREDVVVDFTIGDRP